MLLSKTISKEIMIPLDVIFKYAQLMLDKVEDRGHQEVKMLKMIKNSANMTLCSMNDLIDQTFIINGVFKKQITNFDVFKAIKDCIEMVELEAKERNMQITIEFNYNCPQWISCDRQRLQQVLLNLLTNAMKFSKRKSMIEVNVSFDKMSFHDTCLFVSVRDFGVGIETNNQQRLFKSVRTLEANQISQSGAGLGLKICKKICKQMGGDIWFHSQIGKGSIFNFSFSAKVGSQVNHPE